MTENRSAEQDALALSALLASRLCHDLVNPVGAVRSGLEILDDPAYADGSMREDALELIRTSATRSIALLKFARLAYGAAGSFDSMIPLAEAREVMTSLYNTQKADLVWNLNLPAASKEQIKILLTFVQAVADFVPRGGTVMISGDASAFEIEVTAKQLYYNEDFVKALDATPYELSMKQTPILIAAMLARACGGAIHINRETENCLRIRLEFAQSAQIEDVALTAS